MSTPAEHSSASYLICGLLVPFEKRSTYFGLFGVAYVIASISGPLIGGSLTDVSRTGWRWTFYLNEFPGAITILLLVFGLPTLPALAPYDQEVDDRPKWQRILRLDWIGAGLALGFVTALCVGLQYGGVTKAWSNASVIVVGPTLLLSGRVG